jgi:hypothetical protein
MKAPTTKTKMPGTIAINHLLSIDLFIFLSLYQYDCQTSNLPSSKSYLEFGYVEGKCKIA